MKELGHEHHVYDANGFLKGLYSIDVDKAKEVYSYWEGIDAIVQAYTMLNPMEVRQVVQQNKWIRDGNTDKFARGKSKAMRHALDLPPGLYALLMQYDQELFSDKAKLHRFMRSYGGFTTCQVI